MKRTIGVLVAAIAAATLFSGTAHAGLDYGLICSLSVEDPTPSDGFAPGTAITVIGQDFEPDFDTEILFDGASFTPPELVNTGPTGNWTEEVTIPVGATPGTHTISAGCTADATTDSDIEILGGGQTAPVFVVDPNQINCAATLTGFADLTQPGTQVTFRVRAPASVLATVTSTGASGRADFTVANFGSNLAAGTYDIVSNGTDQQGAAFELSVAVTLTKESCPTATTQPRVGGGTTPRTGSDIGPQVAAGVGVVAVGAALVAIARRRKVASAAV